MKNKMESGKLDLGSGKRENKKNLHREKKRRAQGAGLRAS
jgi:hypothetical protein